MDKKVKGDSHEKRVKLHFLFL